MKKNLYLFVIFAAFLYCACFSTGVLAQDIPESEQAPDIDTPEEVSIEGPAEEEEIETELTPEEEALEKSFLEDDPVLEAESELWQQTIFDDKKLLDGYTEKYSQKEMEILLAMIKDENLSAYRMAAAVRAFKNIYSTEVFSREKRIIEKTLLRRLNRTKSPFVQLEVMHTLCRMNRYKYFNSMAPAIIQKLDHYNSTVNEISFDSMNDIIETGHNRSREARVVFNVIRKMLFLSRRRLATISEPGPVLKQKLELLRWSIKVLGSQEIKRLPKEVLTLL
jgi:hypothetical protein